MKILYSNTVRIASQYQIKFYITAYGLILLMAAAAFIFKEKEIILPELAALSIGCFMHKKNELTDNPMHLFLLPTVTAFMGFFINQFDSTMVSKIILALIAMFMLLHFVKSSLAPVLATGLLPIITKCDSYIFLISIVLSMGILGLLVAMFFRSETLVKNQKDRVKPVLPNLVFLAVLIIWIFICHSADVMQMAAIPPVIVAGYESINKKHYSLMVMYKQVTALVLAAFIGAQSIYYLDNFILASIINFIAIAIILHFLKVKISVVYGMAMLPMVLPGYSHVYFAVNVGVAALVILGSIYILVNKASFLKRLF